MRRVRWRLSTELILWHSAALTVIGLGIGLCSYRMLLKPLRATLQAEADNLAGAMAQAFQQPLWLLDGDGIYDRISNQIIHPDIYSVRVETQFGDNLVNWQREAPSPHPIAATAPVFYRDELIGQVHIAISGYPIHALGASLWPTVLAISAIGIAALLLLTWFLIRRFVWVPLVEVSSSLHEVARGRFDVTLPETRHTELQLLLRETGGMAQNIRERTEALNAEITERQRIEAELVDYRNHLEALIDRRTLALNKANRSLRSEIEKRQKAQHAIIDVSTREQQRIGRDLHDTLGQHLVAARYMLNALERDLATDAPQHVEHTRQISATLSDIMEQARALAHNLMIVDVDAGGLAHALIACAHNTEHLFPVTCQVRQTDTAFPEPDPAASVQLYYIAQEAINNAVRHGNGDAIRLRLGRRGGKPVMLISDNGKGFVPDHANGDGMGLDIMRHRAASIGAALTVWSRPDRGTCIQCRLATPCPA